MNSNWTKLAVLLTCVLLAQGTDGKPKGNVAQKPKEPKKSKKGMKPAKPVRNETVDGVPIYSHSETNDDVDWLVFLPEGSSQAKLLSFDEAAKSDGMKSREKVKKMLAKKGNGKGMALSIVRGSRGNLTKALRRAKAKGLEINFMEEDQIFEAYSTDPTKSWGLDRVDAKSGLDSVYFAGSTRGKGVHVYVVDTGIKTTHKDFGGRAVPTLDTSKFPGEPGLECNPADATCALDNNGHGTHAAGTVGGTSYGIANMATIHAVKSLADDGAGSVATLMVAMDWIAENGEKPAVVSLSLGGPESQSMDRAVRQLSKQGVTIVVAAGNENDDACNYSPARVSQVITVGATTSTDERASFSNYGSCVNIFAPGSNIISAGVTSDDAEAPMSGTSMAAPHATGVAALLLAENPSFTPAEVQAHLLSTSTSGVIGGLDAASPNKLLFINATELDGTPRPITPVTTGDSGTGTGTDSTGSQLAATGIVAGRAAQLATSILPWFLICFSIIKTVREGCTMF